MKSIRRQINPDLKEVAKLEALVFCNGVYTLPHVEELRKFSTETLAAFGHNHAMYTLPTIELIEWLRKHIGDQKAVEIGAGVGIIGKELGIRCTDNMCQSKPEIKLWYIAHQQVPITYGSHVINREANWVARKWQPDIILGSWITQKFNGTTGNVYGPDEADMLQYCKEYIMLGNEASHKDKDIMSMNPTLLRDVPGYVTRSMEPEKNVIYIWKGSRGQNLEASI